MQCGRRNRRITIQAYQNQVDDEGYLKKQWVDVCTVWANIKNYNNKEKFQSDTIHDKQTSEINIRYMKNITNDNRVLYNGIIYNVLSCQNVNEQNVELLLLCEVSSDVS